ncbi:MAG: hypothetical protein AAF560_25705 [Acidobacteriota bacterium]
MQSQDQILWLTENLLAPTQSGDRASSSADAGDAVNLAALRMSFAIEGFGGFTAQSVRIPGNKNDPPTQRFDTLHGDTQGFFRADRIVRLIATGRKNHQLSHWLFTNGDSETFGEGTPTTIRPTAGLQIKAVFEEIPEEECEDS